MAATLTSPTRVSLASRLESLKAYFESEPGVASVEIVTLSILDGVETEITVMFTPRNFDGNIPMESLKRHYSNYFIVGEEAI